jgi:tetratricopeptide (TPR) repeat protein
MGIDRMSTAARIDELLSKFDENPRRYFAPLANEYRKAGELVQAIALCREHLPKQPGHMSGHIVFGQALYESGELAEAQSVFEAALALDPENLIALRHLGDIARGRGDASSARRWYGRVLEADPRNDDIAALLASLAARTTPVSSAAVASSMAPPSMESAPAQAHAFIDEPDWHTPALLGETPPAPSAAISPEVAEPRVDPELLDLGTLAEPEAELPSCFDAPASLSAHVDDAFGAEPAAELVCITGVEADHADAAYLDLDAGAEAHATANDASSAGALVNEMPPHALLSDALGAFASHDPLDSVAELSVEPELEAIAEHVRDDAAPAELEAPLPREIAPEFGKVLEDLEWPDATQLAARTPSPVRSITPVDAWAAVPAVAEALDPEPVDVAEVESLLEAPFGHAEGTPCKVESLLEAPDASADEAPLAVPSLIDAPFEAAAAAAVGDTEMLIDASVVMEASDGVADAPPVAEAIREVTEAASDDADFEPAGDIDEDPPFSAVHMPWLMSTDEEREAEETDLLDSSELPESPAFVTETMAELLVSQGFVSRAVGVYEELVARRPDDLPLASRLAELRDTIDAEATLAVPKAEPAAMPTPIAPLAAFTPAWGVTPRAVPFVAPAPRRTARQWLSRLATMQVARRTPVAGTSTVVSMPTSVDGLASLFGASPMPADDVAARSLATAFGGAVPLDSSTPLFASGECMRPPESPRAEAAIEPPAAPGNTPNLYSFDRFFPDPATAAGAPSASSDAAVAPSAPSARPDDPTSPGADLARFSHWLKGLSNS